MSRAPAMNKEQLQAAVYEPRCHFCRWKKDHPEIAGLVEYSLLNKRVAVKSMIELIAKDYGVRLSSKQINQGSRARGLL